MFMEKLTLYQKLLVYNPENHDQSTHEYSLGHMVLK